MARTKLPDKPSALLLLALADLEKVEASPRYRVDMNHWVVVNHKCSVCLAGAVMTQTLGLTREEARRVARENDDVSSGISGDIYYCHPDIYDEDTERKLEALDRLRRGEIGSALERLNIPIPLHLIENASHWLDSIADRCDSLLQNDTLPEYTDRATKQREEWRAFMLNLVGILQAEGL